MMTVSRASPAAFRLIPRGLEVAPADLRACSGSTLMNRLRSQLVRAGSAEALGWLIAGLHCEYDPTADLLQFHFHGLASSGMIDVIDTLREQIPYRAAATS